MKIIRCLSRRGRFDAGLPAKCTLTAAAFFLALNLTLAGEAPATTIGPTPPAAPPTRSLLNRTAPPPPIAGTSIIATMDAFVSLDPGPAELTWGPISVFPFVTYRFTHGDGIPAAPGEARKTDIHSIPIGVNVNIGDRWSLGYTATPTYYSNEAFRDRVGHNARLSGDTSYRDWDFGVGAAFSSTVTPLVETGRQTAQDTYSGNFDAGYHLGGRALLQFTFEGSSRSGGGINDATDWSNRNWFNYQIVPRLNTGAGFGFGATNVETGSDMSYVDASVRLGWRPTDKIGFDVDAGFENRHFSDSGISNRTSPRFSAAVSYAPVETTTLSVTASRTITPSYFSGQVSERTGVNLGLRQRLLGRFFLDLAYGHSRSSYLSTEVDVEVDRDDKFDTFNARLSTSIFVRGVAAIFYQHSRNSSNLNAFDLTSNLSGFEIGYRF